MTNRLVKTINDWSDMMTEFEKECYRWYGRKLKGHYSHYCPDWDYLPIDDTCVEFQCCTCPKIIDTE